MIFLVLLRRSSSGVLRAYNGNVFGNLSVHCISWDFGTLIYSANVPALLMKDFHHSLLNHTGTVTTVRYIFNILLCFPYLIVFCFVLWFFLCCLFGRALCTKWELRFSVYQRWLYFWSCCVHYLSAEITVMWHHVQFFMCCYEMTGMLQHVTSCSVLYVMLWTEPRAPCLLGKYYPAHFISSFWINL